MRTSSWGPLVAALCLLRREAEADDSEKDRESSPCPPAPESGQHYAPQRGGRTATKDRPTCLTPINHVRMCMCVGIVCLGVRKSPSRPNWFLIMLSFPVKEVYKSSGATPGFVRSFKRGLTAPIIV